MSNEWHSLWWNKSQVGNDPPSRIVMKNIWIRPSSNHKLEFKFKLKNIDLFHLYLGLEVDCMFMEVKLKLVNNVSRKILAMLRCREQTIKF